MTDGNDSTNCAKITLEQWEQLPEDEQYRQLDNLHIPSVKELEAVTKRINALEHGEE